MSRPPDPAQVRFLEELAWRGWPALETRDEAGWRLRIAGGYTKRSNSINALGAGAQADPATLERLEVAYRAREQRPVWRLSPLAPPAAIAALEARGYAPFEESLVQLCPLDSRFRADPEVQILPSATQAWLAAFAQHSPVSPPHRASMERMLARVAQPGFAFVQENGQPLAMALGALEGEYMGLFDVLVIPAARRRGLARRVSESLFAWAMGRGARFAYLQVVSTNAAARPLYADQGFGTVYSYHYRAPPA